MGTLLGPERTTMRWSEDRVVVSELSRHDLAFYTVEESRPSGCVPLSLVVGGSGCGLVVG